MSFWFGDDVPLWWFQCCLGCECFLCKKGPFKVGLYFIMSHCYVVVGQYSILYIHKALVEERCELHLFIGQTSISLSLFA
jgi:high-affinity nickel permease